MPFVFITDNQVTCSDRTLSDALMVLNKTFNLKSCRGYLAPEYAMRGHLTEMADVFGFGVVALEILSGRPNSDNSLDTDKIFLLEWVWERN